MLLGQWIAVGAGAAIGAWLRWGLGLMFNETHPMLALGTLLANVLGGYLMGLAIGIFALSPSVSPEEKLFIMTGMLGGLTTFSTFSAEGVNLISRGEYAWAATHILVHVILSLAMTGLGIFTIQFIKG
ncbi:MAG: fluoride efflux transporter CrcB [Methylophilaceae bacterium]|jgi:CrcB protein